MPTRKPRLLLTLDHDTLALLERLADRRASTMSGVVTGLLATALPALKAELVHLDAAEAARQLSLDLVSVPTFECA